MEKNTAPSDQRRAPSASSGFLQRAVSFRSRTADTTPVSSKGPLGLTTLHNPCISNIVADLVFIHGLGGGSKKTWAKDDDPSLFWPQEWLPHDDDFQDVRIHSFGYDANYDKKSILNIHDFAKDLLGWLKDSPNIPREEQ
ncbi:hypothetical protein BP5796_12973 [Coleophoma crateriformis]|uniref:Uncharacterized protein n=1 Tax=Coleophoma crateriformis TaxID=565419 RepID=A0A3D8Q508_9HELO|nr:hypothetical protein BP5796_12973 [Coleophoma crateriformis]